MTTHLPLSKHLSRSSTSFPSNESRVFCLQLVTYEKVKARLKRRGRRHDHQIPGLDKLPRQVPESTWAGAAAGVASTLVAYPFEALKDRVLIMVSGCAGRVMIPYCFLSGRTRALVRVYCSSFILSVPGWLSLSWILLQI